MNLLLMGARGSGKTSIGRAVAALAPLRFVDLDDRARDRFTEPTVTAIWERHGEAAWRAAEVDALREVLARDDQIVALGGGTPMIPAARTMIETGRRAGGVCVAYLRCTAADLVRRLQAVPGDRPSLTGADPAEEIDEVLGARAATYTAMADVVIDADGSDGQGEGAVTDIARRLIEVVGVGNT